MRTVRLGWMGMLLVCLSLCSTVSANDSVNAAGVHVKADGSAADAGVNVDANGNVSGPKVTVNASHRKTAGLLVKGSAEKEYIVNDDDKTLNVSCNGENVIINGSDNTVTCEGKSAELSINGSGNTVRFKGTCETLIIIGADNHAKVERVGAISALGSGNRVTWAAASRGAKPDIVSTGQNNVISKTK